MEKIAPKDFGYAFHKRKRPAFKALKRGVRSLSHAFVSERVLTKSNYGRWGERVEIAIEDNKKNTLKLINELQRTSYV